MTSTQSVTIQDGGEMRQLQDVADVAEVTPGRLQVVYRDETSEFITGSLFAGFGDWRVWIDRPRYGMRKTNATDPLTMPPVDAIHYQQGHLKFRSTGRIKRLKLPNL